MRLSPSSSSKLVLIGVSNLVHGSKLQQCESSFATSAATDKQLRKKGKRLTSDEQRAMVESFVNKYRAMNMGKFPTASIAVNEVGGNFYKLRKMIQEMEYKSKMSPEEDIRILMRKEDIKVEKLSTTDIGEVASISSTEIDVSSSQVMDDVHEDSHSLPTSDQETLDSNKYLNVKEEQQTSTSAQKVISVEVVELTEAGGRTGGGSENAMLKDDSFEILGPVIEKTELIVDKKTPSEDEVDFKVGEQKVGDSQVESDKLASDSSNGHKDVEPLNKPSMWGNLKSFADGILKMWKKL